MHVHKLLLAPLALAECAGDAEAMQVNAAGLGQVLVSPYCTVNAGNQTQISISNRNDHGGR